MSAAYGKHKSGCYERNECSAMSDFLMSRSGSDDPILCDSCIDDRLSVESIQESRTSRMGNLHPILQPISHVQDGMTIRTEFPMDFVPTGIHRIDDHKLFQTGKEILKALDVRTWTPIPQSHLHSDPCLRQFQISRQESC